MKKTKIHKPSASAIPATPAAPALPEAKRGWKSWLPTLLVLAVCAAVFLYLLLWAGGEKVYGPSRLESDTVTVEKAEVLNLSYDTVEPDESTPDRVEKGNQRALIRILTLRYPMRFQQI